MADPNRERTKSVLEQRDRRLSAALRRAESAEQARETEAERAAQLREELAARGAEAGSDEARVRGLEVRNQALAEQVRTRRHRSTRASCDPCLGRG